MGNDEKIKYICKRTAIGTKAVKPGQTHRLSALDRIMEPSHIRAIYYYKTPAAKGVGEMTKSLKESLAETLNHFPVVCGRLVRSETSGDWMVKCNDAGVRMVDARAKGSVESWLKSVTQEEEASLLVHWEPMFHKPYYWSTFYAQLTEFEKGGLALGLSCTHLLADPITLSLLVKSWADTAFHRKMLDPVFFHPLPPKRLTDVGPNTRPTFSLISHYTSILHGPSSLTAQTSKTVSFLFTEPMVRACISMAQYEATDARPGPFESLAGLFWAAISRVEGRAGNGLIDMSICTDARGALRLDKGFFGNCMVYANVDKDGLDSCNAGPVARAVGEAMNRVNVGEVKDLIEWLERDEIRDRLSSDSNRPRIDGGEQIVCMNLEKMDLYSCPFDSRFEQLRASYYVEPLFALGRVVVMQAPLNEGRLSRVVTVSLPGDQVHKLCEEDVIMEICPSIITKLD